MSRNIEGILSRKIRYKACLKTSDNTIQAQGVIFPINYSKSPPDNQDFAIVFSVRSQNGSSQNPKLMYIPLNSGNVAGFRQGYHMFYLKTNKELSAEELPANIIDRGIIPALLESYNLF